MTIEELIAEVARTGEERHGEWNRDVFAKWAAYAKQVAKFPNEPLKIARAYLELVREGIAEGLLPGGNLRSRKPRTLLELGLLRAPKELASLPPARAIETFAQLWNIAEGMRAEPAWLNDYVLSRQGELAAITELPEWLAKVLEPVLEDTEPSSFTRAFAVHVVDFRPVDPSFLPGDMSLLAPRVLTVRDRNSDTEIGVLLRHEKKSEVTGLLRRSAERTSVELAPLEAPAIEVTGRVVRVGTTEVPLPLLESVRAHKIVPAGFIAVSAIDSQRLWIVESK